MSTAQVVNTGIVGATARVSQPRGSVASANAFVDPLSGAYAAPPRDETVRYDDARDDFESPRRRRRSAPLDQVVSFGGVLVSREVGTTIMKEQAAAHARGNISFAADAERSIAIYEFNQSLMGVAEAVTEVGLSAS